MRRLAQSYGTRPREIDDVLHLTKLLKGIYLSREGMDDSDENDVETVDSSRRRPRGTDHSLFVYGQLDRAVGQRLRKFKVFALDCDRVTFR